MKYSIHLILAFVVGLSATYIAYNLGGDWLPARDFEWARRNARAVLAGRSPYAFSPRRGSVPYPLPAALFAFPTLALKPQIAGALFVGAGFGMLAWALLQCGYYWIVPLLLLSAPAIGAMHSYQWSPWIAAAWYLPGLAPLLVLCKPNIALPVMLSGRISWRGVMLAVFVLLVSFVVYPRWPLDYLVHIGSYGGQTLIEHAPWLVVFALLRLNTRRGRFVFLALLMPLQSRYDLLPWFMLARDPVQMLVSIAASLLVRAWGLIYTGIIWMFFG